MGGFYQLAEKLKQVSVESQERDLLLIMKKHEAFLVDLNIMQMDAGLDANGKKIKPAYAPMTVMLKKLKGQPYDRVTLEDEGYFKRSMFMIVQWPLIISATDSKFPKILEHYGADVMGFNKASHTKVKPEVLEDTVAYCRSIFSLR